uniref:ATP synthase subunit delta, chloroplastic n=1 Tax=Izziella formosana TaxID=1653389 RepID=A0A1G4NUM5_9FLOR|nr:ATP synthase CF1 subunit delta [Izziella formosana]SCW22360.1 ATP synthase CF1 subunit delta [Izziella formosana]
MSTKTLVQQLSQPYAEALLDIAKKAGNVDAIAEDVNLVLQVLAESSSVIEFLKNPLVSIPSKKETVRKLFAGQLNNELLIFILLLIDRKRISYVSDILNRYLEFVYALESCVIADVTTPIQFTEKQKKELIKKLEHMTGKKNVELNISLDSSLIAGFTVQIGSKIIDTSLKGQLKEIGYFLGASNK